MILIIAAIGFLLGGFTGVAWAILASFFIGALLS